MPLAPPDKLAAWEELKVAAFTRALGAAWLLPALDLFVRVQLNILGRHLYLESAVENRWVGEWVCPGCLGVEGGWRQGAEGRGLYVLGDGSRERGAPGGSCHVWMSWLQHLQCCCQLELHAAAPPSCVPSCSGMQRPGGLPKLSAPSQERFLSYAEYLAQQGAARLLATLRSASEAQLAGVALQEALGAAQLAALLQRTSAAFGAAAPGGPRAWASFLLPEPAELRQGLAPTRPDNRAVLLGAEEMLVDAGVVEAMAAEAEAVAAGPEFAAALQVCLLAGLGQCRKRAGWLDAHSKGVCGGHQPPCPPTHRRRLRTRCCAWHACA